MTGAELAAYIGRGLGVEHLRDDDQFEIVEMLRWASRGRDIVKREICRHPKAARLIHETITLVVQSDTTIYKVPGATDPVICWRELRAVTSGLPLVPMVTRETGGEYYTERDDADNNQFQVRLNTGVNPPGGIEADVVTNDFVPIKDDTDDQDIGVPVHFHAAVGDYAIMRMLRVNEESDANNAEKEWMNSLREDVAAFAEMDPSEGIGLRDMILESYGLQYGDMIY